MYLRDERFRPFNSNDDDNERKQPDLLKRLILALLLLLGALAGFAQAPAPYCLKVKVRPMIDHKPAKGVTMRLYKGDQEVIRVEPADRGSNVFMLEKNAYYTIELSSEGRVTRRISFMTDIPDDVDLLPVFKYFMNVELPALSLVNDNFYDDFPIALVAYNKTKDRFEADKKYTAHIKQRLNESNGSTVVNK